VESNSQPSKDHPDIVFNQEYPMVMSIGYNPVYKNDQKTVEPYIMKEFTKDFYGYTLRVHIQGFIRNEADFNVFPHLIEAIHNDVQVAKDVLIVSSN